MEFPQITEDGSAIYYWLNHLEQQDSAYVLVDRDLYLKRKVNTTWSTPVKITGVPVRILSFYDSPATANLTATRFIYPRPIVTGDTISAADLEMVEFAQGVWKTSLLLKSSNAYDILSNPVLTPDCSRMVFRSGQRQAGSEFVYGGLWEMTKEPDPVITYPPTFSSTAIITTIEGKLYTYEVAATDQNLGDTLTFSAPVKPAWLTLVDHGNGTATLSGTPSKSDLGLHLVVLTVTDSTALSATQSFEIKVTVDPTTVFPIPLIGGLFSSAFDQTLFTFLGGTFNEPVNVTYTSWRDRGGPPPMMPPPPPGLFGIGHFFELTAKTESTQEEVQPNKPVTVEIDFGSFPPLPTILGTLKLFRVDGSSFIPLPGVDDPANKKLTAEIDHFSFFSVMGETNQVYLPLIRK